MPGNSLLKNHPTQMTANSALNKKSIWHRHFLVYAIFFVCIVFVAIILLFSPNAIRQPARNMQPSSSQFMQSFSSDASRNLTGPNEAIAATPRQIIFQTQLSLISNTPSKSLDEAAKTVESVGGYVQTSHLEGETPGPQNASATLRIPTDQRLAVLKTLKESAKSVSSETHNAQEIGDQLIDMVARLKQHRAAEEQLLLILATAQKQANPTEHVLSVFQELNRIREQTERLDAQKLSLESRVAFATIHLRIRSPKATIKQDPEPWAPGTDATLAFIALKKVGQSLTTVLIYISIVGIPIGIGIASLLWIINRLTKYASQTKTAV